MLMHDVLSERYRMVQFKDISWDPVLREIGQSGRMTKRIVEYFKEGRTKKSRCEIQEQDEDPQNQSYPVHTYRRNGASVPSAPVRRFVVKKESDLVSTMKV